MHGILLIDKPPEWTSFDAVNKIRSVIRQETGIRPKVGHTGTLDPFATGLLIVLIGKKATKKQSRFMQLEKTYSATAVLGKTSTTGDPEGEITVVHHATQPTQQEIQNVLRQFQGEIKQKPHKFSAVKVQGKRAYERARKGEDIEIEPRLVTIHNINLKSYNYPEFEFTCTVSSGTYIRTLVEDIGSELDSGAYTKHLRRESIGKFDVPDAVKEIKKISYDTIKTQLIALE